MSPAENLIARLDGVQKTGPGRWKAKCPTHKDRTASLLITEKDDGKVTLHCFAECDRYGIIQAVGLDWPDLFPPKPKGYDHRPPDKTAFHAADILTACSDELVYAFIVMSDLQRWLADETQGQPPGPDTRARFLKATERIRSAADFATGRHIKADEERRAIIAAGMLTPDEEEQLKEYAIA